MTEQEARELIAGLSEKEKAILYGLLKCLAQSHEHGEHLTETTEQA